MASQNTKLAPFTGSDGRLVHVEMSPSGTVYTRVGGGGLEKVSSVTAKDAAHAGQIARSKHGERK